MNESSTTKVGFWQKVKKKYLSSAVSKDEPVSVIQQSIGQFGKYQFWLCMLVFLTKFPIAWNQIAIIFLAPKVSFTCNGVKNRCPCSNPEYDRSIFSRTMIMEWNLICERQYLASMVQIMLQFGALIGSIVFGMASDKFGRRPPLIVAIIIQVVAGIVAAYMRTFAFFCLFRFLVGVSVGGTMVIGFVCIMEFCGHIVSIISTLYQIPFTLGYLSLPAFGYYFRDFSDFQVAISLPVILLLSFYWLLPETPRWLIAMKRAEDTIKLCERVATVNKLPKSSIRLGITAYQEELEKSNLEKGTLLDLFRTPNLRKNILNMAFNWLACGYCFYGVSQYISYLSGNMFVNVSYSAGLTLVGTLVSAPLMEFIPRKIMLVSFQGICSICLFILAFIPENIEYNIGSVICASIGNVAAFIVFILVYLYCSELFPTVVRTAAIGFCSMSARIGSMIAPFVVDLRHTAAWLPAVVFAIVPAIASVIALALPETKNVRLITTLEEGEQIGQPKNTPLNLQLFGRRPPLIVAIIIQVVAGIVAAYMRTFAFFCLFRFLVGVSVGGTMVIGFVCIMEFCGHKYRSIISTLYQIPFTLGYLSLPAFGYYFRDFSDFQVAISLPVILLLSFYWLLPETPRWLIAMKRAEDTIKLCERVATVNKLPKSSIRLGITAYQEELEKSNLEKGTLLDLFRTPNLRKNILNMAFNWLACGYCFYGVSQYISYLSGNMFVNVSYSAGLTLVGTLVSAPLMEFIPRKIMLVSFQGICSICLFILAFIPENIEYNIGSVICASIGNVAAFIVFILVYLYCSELFPTVVRTAAIGFCSMSARIGSMIAPFVVDLRHTAAWLPAVVFAIVPAIASVIALALPETKNVRLITTLEEGEQIGQPKNTPLNLQL